MLFKEAPKDFTPAYETVSCFCQERGDILLIQRQDHKREGGKWGIPAGKIEPTDKTREDALIRELREETGWNIQADNLYFMNSLYVRYPDHDFIFSMYQTQLLSREGLKLEPKEHKSFMWVKPEIALKMDLVRDFAECIEIAFNLVPE